MQFNSLVSPEWLQEHLNDVVILDGSYYLPTMDKDPDAEFVKGHIPGAQRWNIDQIADTSSGLKHMMPTAARIAEAAGALGVTRDTTVVVYDQLGMFSAARVWLAFKSAGHQRIALLDGGLPCWTAELQTGPSNTVAPLVYGDFSTYVNTAKRDAVMEALNDDAASVVDARAANRFRGEAPEPQAGLQSGHMPGALNIPYGALLDKQNKFKSVPELEAVFSEYGLDLNTRIITSCGSGVTACIVTFALTLMGVESAVYDGSWSEWGDPALQLPVQTGVSS